MRYLITGKNGQLAQAFIKRLEVQSHDVIAPEKSAADITNIDAMRQQVNLSRPHVIINCAAYNAVDTAEKDKEKAFHVNSEGPRVLAELARETGASIVHFGSDYVFDGTKETGLYVEQDSTNPLNEYGKSKLAGEINVRNANDRHLVLRLSWVFGEGKQNFIHKLLEWSSKNEYLKISCDEFSVPTYTETVVDVTLEALRRELTGVFHLTNSGYCSRYEWASFILWEKGINKFIRPVHMDAFPQPAKRPAFSAMDNGSLRRLLGITIPDWRDDVRKFLRSGVDKK